MSAQRQSQLLRQICSLLGDTLQLGPRATALDATSPLLGALPEFDSMAVVNLLTAVEEQFGIAIADDEVSADIFATVGTLVDFVASKTAG